jgi:hypothetical protein
VKKPAYASGAQTRKCHYILKEEDIVTCLLKARIGKSAETAFARERLSNIARQWLSSHHVIDATIEELLEAVFSVRSTAAAASLCTIAAARKMFVVESGPSLYMENRNRSRVRRHAATPDCGESVGSQRGPEPWNRKLGN